MKNQKKLQRRSLAILMILAVVTMYSVPMTAFAAEESSGKGNAPKAVVDIPVNMYNYDGKVVNVAVKALSENSNDFTFLGTAGAGSDSDEDRPDFSKWTKKDGGIYTGLVQSSLNGGKNGEIAYSTGINGINLFNGSNETQGITAYNDVQFPFTYVDGKYEFDSTKQKAAYNGASMSVTPAPGNNGFWPFDDQNGKHDYHFGMEMETDFYIPQDQSKDVTFDFLGDDDVWVFIDGKLVLDIGGIHDTYGGSINFTTGKVSNPKVNKAYGNATAIESLTQVFGAEAFQPGTKHTMKVFYLERGAGQSNCKIQFNFIPKQELTIAKDITNLNPEITSTQDFEFKLETRALEASEYSPYNGTATILNASSGAIVATQEVKDGMFFLKENQKAKFPMIEYGSKFHVTETVPGDGMQFEEMTWKDITGEEFELKGEPGKLYVEGTLGAEDGQVCDIICENNRITTDVKFAKIEASDSENSDSIGLSGAAFTLSGMPDGTEGTETVSASAISDSNGEVTFKDIPVGTYKLEETKRPVGYEESEYIYKVKVTNDGQSIEDFKVEIYKISKDADFETTEGTLVAGNAIENTPVVREFIGKKIWNEGEDKDQQYRPTGIELSLLQQVSNGADKWSEPLIVTTAAVSEANDWAVSLGEYRTHDKQTEYRYSITESAIEGSGSLKHYNAVTSEPKLVKGQDGKEIYTLTAENTLKGKHLLKIVKERKGNKAATASETYNFALTFDNDFKPTAAEIAACGLTEVSASDGKTVYHFSLTVPENSSSAEIQLNVMEGIGFELTELNKPQNGTINYFLDLNHKGSEKLTGVMNGEGMTALVQNNYGSNGITLAKQATSEDDGGELPGDAKESFQFEAKFWVPKGEEAVNEAWMKDVTEDLESKKAAVAEIVSGAGLSMEAVDITELKKVQDAFDSAENGLSEAILEKVAADKKFAELIGEETAEDIIEAYKLEISTNEATIAGKRIELEALEASINTEADAHVPENTDNADNGDSAEAVDNSETLGKIEALREEIAALQSDIEAANAKISELQSAESAAKEAGLSVAEKQENLDSAAAALTRLKTSLNLAGDEAATIWESLVSAANAQIDSQKAYDLRMDAAKDEENGILAQIKDAIEGFVGFIFGKGDDNINITGDVVPGVGETGIYTFGLKSAEEVTFNLDKYMTENPDQKIIYYSFEETNGNGAKSTYVLNGTEVQKSDGNRYQGEITSKDDMLKTVITFVNRFDGVEPPPVIDPTPDPDPIDPTDPTDPEITDPSVPGGPTGGGGGGGSTTPPTTEIPEDQVPAGPVPTGGEEMIITDEEVPAGPIPDDVPEEIIITDEEIPAGPSILPNTGGMGALLLCGLGAGIAALGTALRKKSK